MIPAKYPVDVITQIRSMYKTENRTLEEISVWLYNNGYKNPRGKALSTPAVWTLIAGGHGKPYASLYAKTPAQSRQRQRASKLNTPIQSPIVIKIRRRNDTDTSTAASRFDQTKREFYTNLILTSHTLTAPNQIKALKDLRGIA